MKLLQLKHIIRTKLKLKETEGLFMFVDGCKLQAVGTTYTITDNTLEEIYKRHSKDQDNVLKLVCQNTEAF